MRGSHGSGHYFGGSCAMPMKCVSDGWGNADVELMKTFTQEI